MIRDIDKRIVDFLNQQKKYSSREVFRTREIADAVGLTIYQVRGHLERLRSTCVLEKVNSGRGVPGQWKLF
ncbi:FaeA/PapI family transcriptional regulator [Escherichia coli]|uniref:FaeA/PapI family transcriptional regulator n=1 Tax=Escherichia coli TaxID=562 RepID=UPI0008FBF354|nr:FaeA/PapI family transcriptional regulator [Escherichia coli]MDY1736304.1 FaeA/PapI family transcriptional regulator [Klebsiella pneumoniae]